MEQLVQQLKVILGTNFNLYFKSHSFHWNIEGENFVEYHTYLGEFYQKVFTNVDTIAEKIRMLDSYAPTGLSRIMELSAIEETDNIPDDKGMFTQLKTDNDKMIIQSKPLISELKNYIATGSSYQAKVGHHDDLTSATLLAIRMMAVLKDWDPRIYNSFNQAEDIEDYEAPMPIFVSSNY